MIRKIAIILILILGMLCLTTIQGISVYNDIDWPWLKNKNIVNNDVIDDENLFNIESYVTNEEAMILFSKLMGQNILPTNEDEKINRVKEIVSDYLVQLPSDLVYSKEEWQMVWRNILTGKTLFEKLGEDKYSVTLIQGYFKIYLNEKGYLVFKKGMIPPQVEFYSPYTEIENFTEETLNRPATKGFILELMSIYDMKRNIKEYTIEDKNRREKVLDTLTILFVENNINKKEQEWGKLDIDRYNYVSMSYAGAMQYAILRGYIQSDNTLEMMNKPIKRIELIAIVDKVNKIEKIDNFETLLIEFISKKNIEILR